MRFFNKTLFAISIGLCFHQTSVSAAVVEVGDVLPSPANPAADYFIGHSAVGSVQVNNGSVLSNSNGRIGDQATAQGSVTVTGAGSQWNNSAELFVGSFGQGELLIENGGQVRNSNGKIGDQASATGSVTVTGVGSSWNNNAELFVGSFGQGALNIENGATVTSSNGKIGDQLASQGSVRVSGAGSTWNNNSELFVGSFGAGSLTIEAGAHVTNTNGKVGDQAASQGSVSVTGAGSSWTNNSELFVGSFGTGELSITDGATVTSTNTKIGDQAASSGTVNVSGMGSSLSASADLFVGRDGEGRLVIEDSATVNVTNTARVGAAGTLQLGLGELNAEDLVLEGLLSIAFSEEEGSLLNISNTAFLGGTLELDFASLYLPEDGDSFTFLQAGTISGSFDDILFADGLTDLFDFNFTSDYSGFSVAAKSVPEPKLLPLIMFALVMAMFMHRRRLTLSAEKLAFQTTSLKVA